MSLKWGRRRRGVTHPNSRFLIFVSIVGKLIMPNRHNSFVVDGKIIFASKVAAGETHHVRVEFESISQQLRDEKWKQRVGYRQLKILRR